MKPAELRKLNNLGHSIGIALGACTVPAAGQPSFELQDDEMEFGVGIHGEPGIDRRRFTSLDRTVDEMFDTLLENGAYNEDWADVHMHPEQTLQAHLDLRGKALLDRILDLDSRPRGSEISCGEFLVFDDDVHSIFLRQSDRQRAIDLHIVGRNQKTTLCREWLQM